MERGVSYSHIEMEQPIGQEYVMVSVLVIQYLFVYLSAQGCGLLSQALPQIVLLSIGAEHLYSVGVME